MDRDFDPLKESTPSLLRRARRGDTAAIEAVVARHFPRLRRWAHGRLPSSARSLEDTDDLIQTALSRTLSNLDRVEADRSGGLQSYMRAAVLNRVRDHIRRDHRRPTADISVGALADPGPSPLENVLGKERLEAYEAALAQLTDLDRELVIARLEDGLTYRQIASEFEKPSEDAARMAVARAVMRLASRVREIGEETGE